MGNISRLGGIATIIAMAGATAVVRDSEADPAGFRDFMEGRGVWDTNRITRELNRCPDSPLKPELGRELANLTLDNIELRDKLDATRAQVADLIEQLETTEQTCGAISEEDGCPAECGRDGYGNQYNGPVDIGGGTAW